VAAARTAAQPPKRRTRARLQARTTAAHTTAAARRAAVAAGVRRVRTQRRAQPPRPVLPASAGRAAPPGGEAATCHQHGRWRAASGGQIAVGASGPPRRRPRPHSPLPPSPMSAVLSVPRAAAARSHAAARRRSRAGACALAGPAAVRALQCCLCRAALPLTRARRASAQAPFLGERRVLSGAADARRCSVSACGRGALSVRANAAAAEAAPAGTPVKATTMLVVGATGTLGRQARAAPPRPGAPPHGAEQRATSWPQVAGGGPHLHRPAPRAAATRLPFRATSPRGPAPLRASGG